MSKKVWAFVKGHKKEIILTSLAIVGGTALFIVTKKKPECLKKVFPNFRTRSEELNYIDSLDWKVGKLTDLWNEFESTNAVVYDVKIEELGKLGDEFLKIGGLTQDDTVSAVIGIDKIINH